MGFWGFGVLGFCGFGAFGGLGFTLKAWDLFGSMVQHGLRRRRRRCRPGFWLQRKRFRTGFEFWCWTPKSNRGFRVLGLGFRVSTTPPRPKKDPTSVCVFRIMGAVL